MIKATYKKHLLKFKQASGTSRGILKTKETYFLILENNTKKGIGECGLFKGLSFDDVLNYEEILQWTCTNIHLGKNILLEKLHKFPSIQFGIEQAFLTLESEDNFVLFPSKFTKNKDVIPINGLIWMGSKEFMKQQIIDKLKAGFLTIKLKIGAIDFQTELHLLKAIRNEFSAKEITLRVDANGAFTPNNALEKLKRLSQFELHSIEQPIQTKQWQEMANLCDKTPLPIALDEELIGVIKKQDKKKLIQTIKPQFIILKPSLIGGFQGANEWIHIIKNKSIDYWLTSALESNIGLNAIAQYTYWLNNNLPQGLGTGNLFTNNINSPLVVKNGSLSYDSSLNWNLDFFNGLSFLQTK